MHTDRHNRSTFVVDSIQTTVNIYTIKLPSVMLGGAYDWAETWQPRALVVASAVSASRGLERSSNVHVDSHQYYKPDLQF